jgi:hypothetical protein
MEGRKDRRRKELRMDGREAKKRRHEKKNTTNKKTRYIPYA